MAWTAGGLFAIRTRLWSVAGVEIISVENGILEVGRQLLNFRNTKKDQISDIRHLAMNFSSDSDLSGMGYQRNIFGLKGGGVLKFDYGLKTLKFGGGIDEAEGPRREVP